VIIVKKNLLIIVLVQMLILCFWPTMQVEAQATPELVIEPSLTETAIIGELFNISVNIYDVEVSHKLTSVQFRVLYNDTLVEPINVYEGPFLQQFNNTAEPPYTYFIVYIEDDPFYGPNVLIGILLIPNATGYWTNFPYGNGTLATITFRSILQTGEPEAALTSDFQLEDTMLLDDTLTEITHSTVDGNYTIQPLTFTYEPEIPIAGKPIMFTAPQSNSEVTYSWNFGDGTSETTTEITIGHIYALPGEYNVTLTCTSGDLTPSTVTKTIHVFPYPPTIDLLANVGDIHFRGEIAEFSVLVTNFGETVDPTKPIEAYLYYNNSLYMNLTDLVQKVDTGFYTIRYTIPTTAKAGKYTLIAKAQYYNAKATSLTSFLISSTFSGFITEVEGSLATISTNVTQVLMDLDDINATLVRVDGTVATINSTVGVIQAYVDDINLTVTQIEKDMATGQMIALIQTSLGNLEGIVKRIEGNVTKIATIETDLGTLQADVTEIIEETSQMSGNQGTIVNLLYITIILALIAAIASIYTLMKRKG